VFQDGLRLAGRTYTGTRDASINGWQVKAKMNFGKEPELRTCLIKFRVFRAEGGPVPDGAEISSAKLLLFKTSAHPAGPQLHELLKFWTESSVTWNSRTSEHKWAQPGCNSGGVDRSKLPVAELKIPWRKGWEEFDVTASLRAWSRGQRRNRGWLISGPNRKARAGLKFHSREYAEDPTKRPKLEITYRPKG
jgi:hypothetical protein